MEDLNKTFSCWVKFCLVPAENSCF